MSGIIGMWVLFTTKRRVDGVMSSDNPTRKCLERVTDRAFGFGFDQIGVILDCKPHWIDAASEVIWIGKAVDDVYQGVPIHVREEVETQE